MMWIFVIFVVLLCCSTSAAEMKLVRNNGPKTLMKSAEAGFSTHLLFTSDVIDMRDSTMLKLRGGVAIFLSSLMFL